MSPSNLKATESSTPDIVAVLRSHENYVLRQPQGKRAFLRFVNLDGIYLSKRRLDEIDFSGATLRGANFAAANLSRASLSCTDLTNANFAGTNLSQADLRGARVSGANFDNADMERSDFRQATIAVPGKSSWTVVGQGQSLANVHFKNCSLKGAKLNHANLKDANFDGALLNGASFKGAVLGNASFEGAVLIGVEIAEMCIPKERLINCLTNPGPELRKQLPCLMEIVNSAQVWAETGGRQGRVAVLDGEDIRLLAPVMKGRKLTKMSCKSIIAVGVDFSGCELQTANFEGADLRGAIFTNADLRGASFKGANLAHANFGLANLLPLALDSGTTVSTSLENAILSRANFEGAQRVTTSAASKQEFQLDC